MKMFPLLAICLFTIKGAINSKWKQAGCVKTKFLQEHSKSETNTLDKCTEKCRSDNFAFAGVTDVYCHCGQASPPEYARANHSDCSKPCPGNKKTMCGGFDGTNFKMSVIIL